MFPKNENYNEWYEAFYPQLTGSGTWLKGHEINTLSPAEWEKRFFKVLFVRLSTYNDVSSSFTHLLLYQIAKKTESVFPDIAYLPPENDARLFEKHNIPWLLGSQTKLAAKRFSLIGFSNSIVQEIINIPKFLTTSNIPLKRSERLEREDIPLIILGGANAPYTTSIWGKDSFVDGVFIGCGADSIRELLRVSEDGLKNKKTKRRILEELEAIPGFHQTFGSQKHLKKDPVKPSDIELLTEGIVPYHADALGSAHLQISEGCRALCSFCAENWTRKPYRELEKSFLLEKALEMKADMGLEKLNIFSFNFNMHSHFYDLLWDLAGLFDIVSFKSQRFDMLSESSMIECQVAAGKTTFSAGMEGISPRLRRYLNKNLDEEALKESLDLIFKLKSREIKIFLLSTALETDDDFRNFENFLDTLAQNRKKHSAHTRVIFSVTPLVKFPWTPLEFEGAVASKKHEEIIARMTKQITLRGFEARSAMDTKEYLVSQILARSSDVRVGQALLETINQTGFTYYIRISGHFFNSFLKHLKENGLEIDTLLKGFSYKESFDKKWADFDMNVDRKVLWEIYQKNILFEEAGASFGKRENPQPRFSPQEYKNKFRKTQDDAVHLSFLVNINENGRGIARKYIGIALARALMKAEKTLTPYFRHYVSSYWEDRGQEDVWLEGKDIIILAWDKKALGIFESKQDNKSFSPMVTDHFRQWGEFLGPKKGEAPSFRLRIDSPYKLKPLEYFKKKGLKYTLYKISENSYNLLFTRESIKKNIIGSCSYSLISGAADASSKTKISLDIVPGIKFKPAEFAQDAFSYPSKNDWVRIRMVSA